MEIDIEEVKEVKLIMWQKEQGFPPEDALWKLIALYPQNT